MKGVVTLMTHLQALRIPALCSGSTSSLLLLRALANSSILPTKDKTYKVNRQTQRDVETHTHMQSECSGNDVHGASGSTSTLRLLPIRYGLDLDLHTTRRCSIK